MNNQGQELVRKQTLRMAVERLETTDSDQEARLQVLVDKDNGVLVTAEGELDYVTRHKLHAVLESLFAQNLYSFALDLAKIEFIDSSGLGLLIMTKRRVDSHEGRLPVVFNQRIERILTTMQLMDFFERFADKEQALDVARANVSA